MSVPLGIATAVYLNEGRGWLPRTVRTVVDAMSAVPTIVAGLFVYSMLVIRFGVERSGFAAAFALSISMVPVVTRTAEVVLRLVPNGLREASLALGCTQWQTVKGVVLPTARSGLVTAVLLGVARVIGETSPVLLVAGSTNELNYDPLNDPQVSLPLFVFNQVRLPLDEAIARAFGAAVVLLLLVVVLFALARIVGGRPLGRPTRRARRRAARARSARSKGLSA
jgi:phosphate transport system permease protein